MRTYSSVYERALACANLCRRNVSFFPQHKFRISFHKDEETSTEWVLVRPQNGVSYIAICGSESKKDWKQNFDIKLVKVGAYKFHRGFYKKALVIAKFIVDNKIMDTVVTGYSQGGAVASIVTLLCSDRITKLITFATPKFAKHKTLVSYYSHFLNANDWIRFMPPLPWYGKVERTVLGEKKFPFISFKEHDINTYIENLEHLWRMHGG